MKRIQGSGGRCDVNERALRDIRTEIERAAEFERPAPGTVRVQLQRTIRIGGVAGEPDVREFDRAGCAA